MKKLIKAHVDRFRENIIWKAPPKSHDADVLNVEMAGVTFPDKNYAIRRNRNTKKVFDNLFVIEYVTSGVGYLESEGIRVKVGAGDLYIIHRRTVHSYYADKQEPFSKKWINVSGSFINAMASVFFEDGPFTVVPIGTTAEKIIDDIHGVLGGAQTDRAEVNTKIMHRLLDLFVLMDEHKKSARQALTAFEQIAMYIEQNVCSDLTVSAICSKFFISSSTLYRLFISNAGKSPKAYIQSKKIDAAKRMIAANDSSFNTIAAALGFYDSHHFFKVFRESTGMSPSEYREKILDSKKDMQL